MNITRKEREELCKLSEESFGGKYDWLKYINQPHYVKEEVTTNAGVKRMVKVAKWRTLADVKALMTGKDAEETVEVTNEGT